MKTTIISLFISIFFITHETMAASKAIAVHGHRGARAVRPENTLNAFDYALSIGVDVLELDLSVTKDDKIIVSHDSFIDPLICLDKKGKKLKKKIPIRTLILEQVKTYDCGSLINPRFPRQIKSPGEKMPTLEEVFELVKNSEHPTASNVEFNAETKLVPKFPEHSVSPKKFVNLIYRIIKKYKMQKRFILQSFDYRTLKAMKSIDPVVRVSQLTYKSMVNLTAAIKSIKGEFSSPHFNWINAEMVKDLHKNNIQVAPWSANDMETWNYLINIGVDAIITDDPAKLIKYLKNKKLR